MTATDSGVPASRRGVLMLSSPGLLLAVLLVTWTADGGGFSPLVWYPGALFVLALLAIVVTAAGPRFWAPLGEPGYSTPALLLLGAFTLWSFLSIAWAGVRGDAWDGANRTLLYFLVFLLCSRWRWSAAAAAATLAATAVGIAGVGVVTLVSVIRASDPARFFVGARLVDPTGYPNATAAVYLIAFWPVFYLASRRELPPVLRGVAFGVAGLLLESSLIPESRGAVFTLPVAALLYGVLVPNRARSLLAAALVAVPTALVLPSLLDVYRTGARGGDLGHATRAALVAMAIAFPCTAAAGTLLAFLDRRLEPGPRVMARVNASLAVLAAVAVVAAAAALVVSFGNPGSRIAAGWRDFRSAPAPEGSTHFGGLGSHRYDFWRVALEDFRSHPVGGVGVDNFAVSYLRHRRSSEEPLYPHSIEMRLLGQTGLVGTGLFVGFLAFAVGGVVRRWRRAGPFSRGLVAAALVSVGYWLGHGSADWLWEFPALGACAFACLGIAAGVTGGPASVSAPGGSRSRWRIPVAAAVGAAAIFSFAAPWAAARDVAIAESDWRGDRAGAFALLGQAARFNPFDDQAYVTKGVIAARSGEDRTAADSFEHALGRNSLNWFAWLELALADARLGDHAGAVRAIGKAEELDPRDSVVRLASGALARGRPIPEQQVDRLLIERVEQAVGKLK